jgi:2-aminoethylphosphonate-pyruvate transaminase
MSDIAPPHWRDKALFTPGPLTTSRTVKEAMLRDLGSRDETFISTVRDIRRRLLEVAGVSADDFTAVPMQGSGTFGLESVVASAIPPDGKLLVAVNGAYGRRVATMGRMLGIPTDTVDFAEDEPVDPDAVARALEADPAVSHVSVCHCETTSGILNPVGAVGAAVRKAGRAFFVDAMSTFGAIPVDLEGWHIDYMVSSANKCVEGVPGFSFVLARKERLLATRGWARSLSLDLLAQHEGLEKSGQFRFTPPTHGMLAFRRALLELEAEGGVAGRGARYCRNQEILLAGMRAMGFREYLHPGLQSCIITSFRWPTDSRFDFETFYTRLSEAGCVIYPGKVGDADCFRVGTVGRLFPEDYQTLLASIARVKDEMGFTT